jgi:hypothetical protein
VSRVYTGPVCRDIKLCVVAQFVGTPSCVVHREVITFDWQSTDSLKAEMIGSTEVLKIPAPGITNSFKCLGKQGAAPELALRRWGYVRDNKV